MKKNAMTLKVARAFYLLSPVVALIITAVALKVSSLTVAVILNYRSSIGQIAGGALAGLVLGALVATVLLEARMAAGARELALTFFRNEKPRWVDLLMTATMAGLSEELLFRGVLQPLTNLWIASAVFAVAHGAGSSLERGKLIYHGLVLGLGLLLGMTASRYGLPTAMAMHGTADLVFLVILQQWCRISRAG